ncbi:MAG: alpha/beta hydrolase, partial [Calditrichia bacterium]
MIRFNDDIFLQLNMAGLPVVFLHAFPVHSSMWKGQVDFLKDRGISSICLDYPGFGRSTVQKKEFSMADIAGQVAGMLQALQVRKAVFAGLSMGGYVALSLYARNPELFAGLLLASTRASDDNPETRERRTQLIGKLKKTMDLQEAIQFHLEKFFTKEFKESHPEEIEQTENWMQEATIAGVIQAQTAMAGRPDSSGLLEKMNFPVIVVAGEQDELTRAKDSQMMAQKLPNGEYFAIPHAAHLCNVEQPERFNEALWRLLAKVKQS